MLAHLHIYQPQCKHQHVYHAPANRSQLKNVPSAASCYGLALLGQPLLIYSYASSLQLVPGLGVPPHHICGTMLAEGHDVA